MSFNSEHLAAFTGSRAIKCEHLSRQLSFLDGNPLEAERKGLIEKRQGTSCALASHVKIKSQRYSIKAGDF